MKFGTADLRLDGETPDMQWKLLDAATETSLWTFLSSRSDQAHLVLPIEVYRLLLKINPRPAYSFEPFLGERDQSKNIYLWDLDRDRLAEARRRFPETRVLGVFEDVWPSIVTKTNPLRELQNSAHSLYALICLPRSGSTYLCDLLERAGLGQPREHVRDLFLELLRAGRSIHELMGFFIRRGSPNGIFGTKLISNYLASIVNSEPARTLVREWLTEHNSHILVLRRDLIDQTISAYFAKQTAQWHVRGKQSISPKYDEVEYDFAALETLYRSFVSAEAQTAEFAAQFPNHLELNYDEIEKYPHDAIQKVATLLGWSCPISQKIDTANLTQKISSRVPRMSEFKEHFSRELAGRVK